MTVEITVKNLFDANMRGPLVTGGDDTQYRIEDHGNYAVVVFQGSVSKRDWENNFAFWVKPYRDMPKRWYAHAGFVRAYKAVRNEIIAALVGKEHVIVTGYSHGAALATMLHEDLVFNNPGFQGVHTVTFGGPRVVWMSKKVRQERFKTLYRVAHARDIVTMLPPWLFGYIHVGGAMKFGEAGLPAVKYHYSVVYGMLPWQVGEVVIVDTDDPVSAS